MNNPIGWLIAIACLAAAAGGCASKPPAQVLDERYSFHPPTADGVTLTFQWALGDVANSSQTITTMSYRANVEGQLVARESFDTVINLSKSRWIDLDVKIPWDQLLPLEGRLTPATPNLSGILNCLAGSGDADPNRMIKLDKPFSLPMAELLRAPGVTQNPAAARLAARLGFGPATRAATRPATAPAH